MLDFIDDGRLIRVVRVGVCRAHPAQRDWTPRKGYDLATENSARSLYQVVLREARCEDEIETYLNASLLCRLWRSLTLPRAVRECWEAQHPALASG